MRDEVFGNVGKGLNKTTIGFVLDQSGSMSSIKNETILAVNKYLDDLRKDTNSEYSLTLTLFNSEEIKEKYSNTPLKEVKPITENDYIPSGMTPLYDAIGKTINSIPQSKGTKVIIVIMTDGLENWSTKYGLKEINFLITEMKKAPEWTFVFLGADIDAWAVGRSLGIDGQNSISWNKANIGGTMSSLSNMSTSYSNMTPDSYKEQKTCAMNFFKEDKNEGSGDNH